MAGRRHRRETAPAVGVGVVGLHGVERLADVDVLAARVEELRHLSNAASDETRRQVETMAARVEEIGDFVRLFALDKGAAVRVVEALIWYPRGKLLGFDPCEVCQIFSGRRFQE